MLIRTEQMQAFSNILRECFVKRMVQHLVENLFEEIESQNYNEKGLESIVQQGISNAEKYGLEKEDDIKLYIECMMILSPNFDQDTKFPWAKEILNNEDLDSESKMANISEYMIFGLENPK